MFAATSPIVRARGNGGGSPGRLTTCLQSTSLVVCQSSSVKRTATTFSKEIFRTRTVPLSVGGRVRGSARVSRSTFAYGDGFVFGIGCDRSGLGSISCIIAAGATVRGEDGRSGKGKELSASVSVSVSSPGGLESDAGLPVRLYTRTVSSPESFSAKCTFLLVFGVAGADWVRMCFTGRSRMFGVEAEDLREDFNGLPLERMIGVDGVRGRDGEDGLEEKRKELLKNGEAPLEGEMGEEVGKGTEVGGSSGGMSIREGGSIEGENLPAFIDRRRELMGE